MQFERKEKEKNVCVYKSYRVSLTLSVLLILLHLLFNVYTYAHTNLNNIKVIESATVQNQWMRFRGKYKIPKNHVNFFIQILTAANKQDGKKTLFVLKCDSALFIQNNYIVGWTLNIVLIIPKIQIQVDWLLCSALLFKNYV